MTTEEGLRYFRDALITLGGSDGSTTERLQRAWTDHVQHVWEAPHVEGDLADRFRALWERHTGPGDDPRRTNIRATTESEAREAVAELVQLALDVAAARAVELRSASPSSP